MIFQSLTSFVLAALFSLGLFISGFLDPQVLTSFFETNPFNPRVLVTGLAMIMTYHAFLYIIKDRKRPIFSRAWSLPRGQSSSLKFGLGCFLCGVGLSFGGYTPATALTTLLVRPMESLGFIMMLLVGLILGGLLTKPIH